MAGSSKGLTKYPMLYKQFGAPDDGRRNRLKHVEHFTEINKLCNVAYCWLYLKILSYMAPEQEIICVEVNRGLLKAFTSPAPSPNYKFGQHSGFGI